MAAFWTTLGSIGLDDTFFSCKLEIKSGNLSGLVRPWMWSGHRASERNLAEYHQAIENLSPIVQEFAKGLERESDATSTIFVAERIVQAAQKYTEEPFIAIDEEDGDLDFDLRLEDGLLVMANLFVDGSIDASVYDDSQGAPVKLVKRLRRSTTTETEIINLLRAGLNASTS